MNERAMVGTAKDGRFMIGYVLVVTVLLAGASNWLSDLTAGPENGGRYDLPVLNAVAWSAFLLFAAVAIMTITVGAVWLVDSLRPGRERPSRF